MDIDPLDLVKTEEPQKNEAPLTSPEKQQQRLNTYVAVMVALIATFIGVCKVKDDNIVQAMQQAQANRIDDWALYQARNIRSEIAKANAVQLQLQARFQLTAERAAYEKQITFYQDLANREDKKKEEQKAAAENDQKTYDQLNFHDDQFDLSDAALSLAISLLAITSLSQKRWLFVLALLPTSFGVVMGLAGLLGWNVHPDALIKPLSQNPQQEWQIARGSSRPVIRG
jgi:ribosomal protein S13